MSKKNITFLVSRSHSEFAKLQERLLRAESLRDTMDLLAHKRKEASDADASHIDAVVAKYLSPGAAALTQFDDGRIEFFAAKDGNRNRLILVTVTAPGGYLISLFEEAMRNKEEADKQRSKRLVAGFQIQQRAHIVDDKQS